MNSAIHQWVSHHAHNTNNSPDPLRLGLLFVVAHTGFSASRHSATKRDTSAANFPGILMSKRPVLSCSVVARCRHGCRQTSLLLVIREERGLTLTHNAPLLRQDILLSCDAIS
jgi:hypothetical protein